MMVIQQAEKEGVFNREHRYKGGFAFSHLYTGLDYDGFKRFLKLSDETAESKEPVPKERIKELGELCKWLYGDNRGETIKPVIQSQNPDLALLDEILQKDVSIDALRSGLSLPHAHDVSLGEDRVFGEEAHCSRRNTILLALWFTLWRALRRRTQTCSAPPMPSPIRRTTSLHRWNGRARPARSGAARETRKMFKIGETPTLTAHPTDHADYLEIECLRQSDGNASGQDLIAALKKLADDAMEDRNTSDDRFENIVTAAFAELKCRAAHSGRGYYRYPFRVSEDDQLLDFTGTVGRREFYLFLLLATRMNMREHRVQADINGTELFEKVCCEVAKNYWGSNTEGLVFGTARRSGDDEVGNFQQAVNDLCARL